MPSIHLFIKQFIMLSTIKIDFDGDMNPVIIVNQVESEDVRDKLVRRFFGSPGSLSIIQVKNEFSNSSVAKYTLTPDLTSYPLLRHKQEPGCNFNEWQIVQLPNNKLGVFMCSYRTEDTITCVVRDVDGQTLEIGNDKLRAFPIG